MIKKKEKPQTEEVLGFRPLIKPDSKMKPLKQIFNGFEIEKRQLLLTVEEDHTRAKNGLVTYNEVLENGVDIRQGYIKDVQQAKSVLTELGISLNEFQPNTIRLRKYGTKYILTLKDNKGTKKREVEFKLSRAQFNKYWPITKGARVTKKRLEKKIKGHLFEIDAFTDRFLLIAECEVQSEEALSAVPKMGMDITGNSSWTNKRLSK
jgi:CYTH domain-containing protein